MRIKERLLLLLLLFIIIIIIIINLFPPRTRVYAFKILDFGNVVFPFA